MPLDFPSSPALNDTYTYNGVTYVFNGTGWATRSDPSPLQLGGFKNLLINGNFDVWQRSYSTTTSTNGCHTADRWLISGTAGSGRSVTCSRQDFTPGQTDVPGEPRYFFRHQEVNAGSGYTYKNINQGIEGVRQFSGRTVTVSFYAKANATLTLVNIGCSRYLNNPGGESIYDTFATDVQITTSWQKFTFTHTFSDLSGYTLGGGSWFETTYFAFNLPPDSTFTLDLARIQLEYGADATDFEERPYNTELVLCQRYYEHSFDDTPQSLNGWQTKGWDRLTGSPIPSDANANYSYFFARFRQPKLYAPTMRWFNSSGVLNSCSWERPGTDNSGTATVSIATQYSWFTGARMGAGSGQGVPTGAFVYANWDADAEL